MPIDQVITDHCLLCVATLVPHLQLLLASCDQEVQSVISLCINAPYCSLQFVAHIYDVLRGNPNAERVIRRQLPHYGVDQAELYTLHYAETLLGHVATWLVAAEYLAWCPVNGAALMESVLDRSPVSCRLSFSGCHFGLTSVTLLLLAWAELVYCRLHKLDINKYTTNRCLQLSHCIHLARLVHYWLKLCLFHTCSSQVKMIAQP